MKLQKKAVVIHSGGMDSSICLALAIRTFSVENVLSLSFIYDQRHSSELEQAKKICQSWNVDHIILSIPCLKEITTNALTDTSLPIQCGNGEAPNTLVVGRNGLMAQLGAIHAHELGAHCIYMGIIGVEGNHSGYRDCSRAYMDLKQTLLRLDLDDHLFTIETPLVDMSKKKTLELAQEMGVLEFLLNETITCYEGLEKLGCQKCPACILRNEGIRQFSAENPSFKLPYPVT
ncbi:MULTISPECIES: 7-cyano-7-deazaguanine synthase QueC [Parachlamydia]|jgi:7-cyano-7-deazaguanine synthase|uniref:7-cyano-7-deazaguanine synthase n=2 Tax=Parachlamydia acanthamoebae TaxID=83552 RepID=F8KZR4_PARAV|nr:7-cyano-7-deazaguanine synthase QueC [Parachlamydia acanthamoebae]EFB42437.1 hypothetical protein pah_c008o049 [Parachlamydia acanthamoebae str. Hall's coccus]CCB86419.1 7-cyano-7-deazaguanine synthase [Parachlamydia acanthamoebae UV-7]